MYNKYFGFRESPFSVTPDPRFFYTNSFYQEALAALLYGIEGRKGFIVVTGEVGTGKTTLLRKLMRNLEATIHPVFIFNTQLSFTQLLKLILHDLGLAPQRNDRLAMMEELNRYLIEQLKQRHIVCLLVDEAQNLSDEALEELRLLSNLETDKEKLLQIVLMGQPELEEKLDQPGLRQLKQRAALHCRLLPLEKNEVGPYIDFRLRAAGYEEKTLFEPEAVEKIAFYSKGIPRLINIICDNAVLIAYAASRKAVAAEMIEEVAHDIQLKDVAAPASEFQTIKSIPKSSNAEKNQRRLMNQPGQPYRNLERPTARDRSRPRQKALAWFGLGILVTLAILGGAAAATLYSQQSRNYLSHLGVNIEDFIGVQRETLDQAKNKKVDPGERGPVVASLEALPSRDPPPLLDDEHRDTPSLPENRTPNEAADAAPQENSPPGTKEKSPDETRTAARNPARMEASKDPEFKRRLIVIQISKAIQDRAISGVEVSLINGIAYLDGRVETERQRFVAERAARSVPDVKYIRNRIMVNSPLTAEEKERQRIQLEISRAIRDRAISGVEVSLVNGIAYLDGQVETERQRFVAERAARSIPDVRYVRNRIVVNSLAAPAEGRWSGLN
jgi:general secretion pathway protein A